MGVTFFSRKYTKAANLLRSHQSVPDPCNPNGSACSPVKITKLGERVHTSLLACKQGTLSTTCSTVPGTPNTPEHINSKFPIAFGSVINYVVDSQGAPVFRIGSKSIHATNIAQNPLASLSLFPKHDNPSIQTHKLLAEETILASVTLIGNMLPVGEEDLTVLKAAYFVAHCSADDDPNAEEYLFYKLSATNIHVCDNAVSCESPLWVNMEEFVNATPNKLMLVGHLSHIL